MIVGVLGGGQLGRMLCQAASQMGIKVIVLDPAEDCPASAIAHDHMVGSFSDNATIEELAKRCFVVIQFVQIGISFASISDDNCSCPLIFSC